SSDDIQIYQGQGSLMHKGQAQNPLPVPFSSDTGYTIVKTGTTLIGAVRLSIHRVGPTSGIRPERAWRSAPIRWRPTGRSRWNSMAAAPMSGSGSGRARIVPPIIRPGSNGQLTTYFSTFIRRLPLRYRMSS